MLVSSRSHRQSQQKTYTVMVLHDFHGGNYSWQDIKSILRVTYCIICMCVNRQTRRGKIGQCECVPAIKTLPQLTMISVTDFTFGRNCIGWTVIHLLNGLRRCRNSVLQSSYAAPRSSKSTFVMAVASVATAYCVVVCLRLWTVLAPPSDSSGSRTNCDSDLATSGYTDSDTACWNNGNLACQPKIAGDDDLDPAR